MTINKDQNNQKKRFKIIIKTQNNLNLKQIKDQQIMNKLKKKQKIL